MKKLSETPRTDETLNLPYSANIAMFARKLERELNELKKDKERLEEDSNFLSCLQACGVDNWEGYDDACDMFEEGK